MSQRCRYKAPDNRAPARHYVRVVEPSGAVDWAAVESILLDMERVLRQASDPGADHIARLRDEVREADRNAVLGQLVSFNMWNHMGSFFDRSLSDRDLDREFRRQQIVLARVLEAAGVASRDVSEWAVILANWEREGI